MLFSLRFSFYLLQSFFCPLGYDGYYADPTTCSSYYICRENVAYHYVIIKLQYNENEMLIFKVDFAVLH